MDVTLQTTLSALAPNQKFSVHEVLRQGGFDVRDWEQARDGRAIENPAVNGRAYAWSFTDAATDQSMFMLWHADMSVRDDAIRYRREWSGLVADLERTRPVTARRADAFLRHVAKLKLGTIVRVGILEGSQASSKDREASSVSRRSLDSELWHLSFWEPMSSTFEFTRGLPNTALEAPASGKEAVATDSVTNHVHTDTAGEIAADLDDIITSDRTLTEKERLVKARLGQGRFRKEVLARWGDACAVTGAVTLEALRASHCKPWRASDDIERLNPANGLPLVATLDALFDVGLISFEDDGGMLVSTQLRDSSLSITQHRLRRALKDSERTYLAYHRASVFRE